MWPLIIGFVGLTALSASGAENRPALPDRAETGAAAVIHVTGENVDGTNLAPLRAVVGNARVVLLGEPAHGVHEPLAVRNRVMRYLVEEMGFTAIAVEASFAESRLLTSYVSRGEGAAEPAVRDCRSWSSEPLEENAQLVRWMRSHNADPASRPPLNFYAIDLNYAGPWGSRPTPAALETALSFVQRAGGLSGQEVVAGLRPWLTRLADPSLVLGTEEHDVLTAAIDNLLSFLEREKLRCLESASLADWEWAHQAAVVAKQTDRMFRLAPSGPPGGPPPPDAWRMVDAREVAMAQNVLWALAQEGPGGRILVVVHNMHAQGAVVRGQMWDGYGEMPISLGRNLRASLGKELAIIGMVEAGELSRTQAAGAFDAIVPIDTLTPAQSMQPPSR